MSYPGPRTRGWSERTGVEADSDGAQAAQSNGGAKMNGGLNDLLEASQSLERSNEMKMKQIHALIEELRETARNYKEQRDTSTAAYCLLMAQHNALEGRCRNLESRALLGGGGGAPRPWNRAPRPADGGIDALLEASQSLEGFDPTTEMPRPARNEMDAARGQREPWGVPQAQAGFNVPSGNPFARERLQFAAYNELMSQHSAPERKRNNLEGMPQTQGEEPSKRGAHEAGERKSSLQALQQAKKSLERANHAKEKRIQSLELDLVEVASRHKKQLDASTAAYCALLSKHSALEGDFKNLGSVAKLRSEEVASLKRIARDVEANASGLRAGRISLEASKLAAESQVKALKEELQRAAREHKGELDSSKAAYEELLDVAKLRDEEVQKLQTAASAAEVSYKELESKHSALIKESESKLSSLDDRCKSLTHEAKLRDKEVAQLKKDAQASEANIVAAREKNEYLGLSNQEKEKQINTLKAQLEAARKEIQSAKAGADALQLKNKQSLESCTEAKEKQIRTLKDESEEAARRHKVQLDSSKAVCRDLEAKLAALESERKNLTDAAKREDKESLKKEARAAKETISSLTASKNHLEQSIQAKEKQIRTLEQTSRGRKEQLDASKAARDELAKKHSALELMCKNLVSAAKLNHEEVQSLKKEAQATKKTMDSLKETNTTLLQQNEENEKQIHTLKKNQEEAQSWKRGAQANKRTMDSLKETNISLAQSIQEKEKQIGMLKKELEKVALGIEDRLVGTSRSAHEEMVAKTSALEDKCKNLESVANLKSAEVASLKKEAQSFRLTYQSLEATTQAKERQISTLKDKLEEAAHRHKVQLDSSKADCRGLEAKLADLEDKCKNPANVAEREDMDSLKKEVQAAKETNSLEGSNEHLERSNRALKKALEEAASKHKIELDASKAACDELAAKHSSLEIMCKNLVSTAKLNHEDVQSMKKDAEVTKKNIAVLEETKRSLEQSNHLQEQRIRTLIEQLKHATSGHAEHHGSSKAAYDDLLVKHLMLEDKCKNLESASNPKSKEVESLKAEVKSAKASIKALELANHQLEATTRAKQKQSEEVAQRHKVELDSSKTACRDMEAKVRALGDKYKNLVSAAKLKDEEVTSLEKDAKSAKSLEETRRSLEQSNQAKEKQIQTLKEELEETSRVHKEQQVSSKAAYEELELKHSALEVRFKNLGRAAKQKIEEVQSLNKNAPQFKIESASSMQILKDENNSLKQSCDEKVKALQAEVKERVSNHEKDVASLEAEIEQLKSNEKSLCNQIDDTAKTKESLQSEVNRLLLKITTLEKDRKDVTSQLENKIEKLTADMQMQAKVNESLHSQITEGLKCKKEMQEKITSLENKLHRMQAGSETNKKKNESPEIAAPGDEVVEKLFSNGSEDRKVGAAVAATAMRHDNALPDVVTSQLKVGCSPPADNAATTATATTAEPKVGQHAKKPSASATTETGNAGSTSSNPLSDAGGDICIHNERSHQNQSSHGNSSTFWHMATEYEFQSEHFDTKTSGYSYDRKQAFPSQVTSGNIFSSGEGPGRGRRKRKSLEAPQKQRSESSAMVKARKSMIRDGGEASSPRAAKPPSTKPGNVKVGDIGYKFKRFFPAFNQWYDGEVIEVLSNGMRRCQYNDGSVEDYRVDFMRRKCRARH